MKILVLTALYPPLGYSGHDERCRQVVEALSMRGHRLQILTSNYRVPPGFKGEKGVFRELNLDRSYPADSGLGENYKSTLNQTQSNAEAVLERLERFNPEVVFVWNREDIGKAIMFGLQARGVPMVYDLHSNWLDSEVFDDDAWIKWWRRNDSKRSKLYRGFLYVTGNARRVQRYAPVGFASELNLSHAYVCSESLRKQLVESEIEAAKSMPVLYPSLNPSKLFTKKRYTPCGNRFMWAGRVVKGKDPECPLYALVELRKRGVDITIDYFAMGEPLEKKALRSRILELGLDDSVSILGIRPGELVEHYKRYDAFLFTSNCQDPFPITPLEAMFSRLPCILSRDGGIEEIVTEGESALLYEAGNPISLANAIQRFLQLPDGGGLIAENCEKNLHARHLIDSNVEKIEVILQASIDSSKIDGDTS